MSNLFTPGNIKIFSTLASAATGIIAVIISMVANKRTNRIIRKQEAEQHFSLTVIPHELLSRHKQERLFFALDFINNSSMPITITDLLLNNEQHVVLPSMQRTSNSFIFTDKDNGVVPKSNALRVSEKIGDEKLLGEISVYSNIKDISSHSLPVTIPAFSSVSGYFGFIVGAGSGLEIIRSRNVTLHIKTNRGGIQKSYTFKKTITVKSGSTINIETS